MEQTVDTIKHDSRYSVHYGVNFSTAISTAHLEHTKNDDDDDDEYQRIRRID